MMKKTLTAVSLIFALALTLTACRSEDNSTATKPDHTPSVSSSQNISTDENDAASGGGAGGTNSGSHPGSDIMDDVGNAVDDIADGIGDAVEDIGSAADDAIGGGSHQGTANSTTGTTKSMR